MSEAENQDQSAQNQDQAQGDTPGVNQEQSFGQKAVGLSFNPSGDGKVQDLKEKAAAFIDACNQIREESTDNEVKRMAAVAITEMQTAQMWAVKAATWQA